MHAELTSGILIKGKFWSFNFTPPTIEGSQSPGSRRNGDITARSASDPSQAV